MSECLFDLALHRPRLPAGRERRGELIMPIETNEDPEVEFSPLSQSVTRDGITVRVAIYRVPEIEGRWSLEVVDRFETSTVWDDLFDTDEDAFVAFEDALEAEGIGNLTETTH